MWRALLVILGCWSRLGYGSGSGRVVLVTGGSRGIGRAICQRFAAEGDTVVVNFHADRTAAEEVLETLPGDGHCVHQCDVADPEQVSAMVDQISERYGRLDVLVNNAATHLTVPVLTTSYADWQQSWHDAVTTNLIGPANLCWCAARVMVQHGGGSIVSVSSRGAFRGEPDACPYGATKAGLNSLSQSLAKALGSSNIGVSAVAPGYVFTDMAAETLNGALGDSIKNESPFKRVADPEEIADVVCFLASSKSRWLSGGVIDCNGASYLH